MTVELFEIGKWALALLSLVGVVLNIKRRRECFIVWTVTNASWVAVDLWHGVLAQAALQAVYVVLAIWGFWHWRQR